MQGHLKSKKTANFVRSLNEWVAKGVASDPHDFTMQAAGLESSMARIS